MAKFYSNENFPLPAVEALRQLQHDVLTTQEAGYAGQAIPDESVLDFAHKNQRILLTLNRKHFIRLHHEGRSHSGVFACTLDVDFARLAASIHKMAGTQENFAGQLVRINRPQTK